MVLQLDYKWNTLVCVAINRAELNEKQILLIALNLLGHPTAQSQAHILESVSINVKRSYKIRYDINVL